MKSSFLCIQIHYNRGFNLKSLKFESEPIKMIFSIVGADFKLKKNVSKKKNNP